MENLKCVFRGCWLWLVIATLSPITVISQPEEELFVSIDVGASLFLDVHETNPDELLNFLGGAEGVERWTLLEGLAAPAIGVNLHYNKWTVGVTTQLKQKNQFVVYRKTSSTEDRLEGAESWFSVYGERYFQIEKYPFIFDRGHPFVGVGFTRSTLSAQLVRSGMKGSFKQSDTDLFIRFGIFAKFNRVHMKMEVNKRFTDSDNKNIIRLGVRIPFG